jgi:hypothetical protein
MTLAPELLADLRKKAEAFAGDAGHSTLVEYLIAANPAVVLALLDRIEALEQGLREANARIVSAETLASLHGAKPVDQMTAGDFEMLAEGQR